MALDSREGLLVQMRPPAINPYAGLSPSLTSGACEQPGLTPRVGAGQVEPLCWCGTAESGQAREHLCAIVQTVCFRWPEEVMICKSVLIWIITFSELQLQATLFRGSLSHQAGNAIIRKDTTH